MTVETRKYKYVRWEDDIFRVFSSLCTYYIICHEETRKYLENRDGDRKLSQESVYVAEFIQGREFSLKYRVELW